MTTVIDNTDRSQARSTNWWMGLLLILLALVLIWFYLQSNIGGENGPTASAIDQVNLAITSNRNWLQAEGR